MDLGLEDKRALVTGSSRGLGYAVGLLLAREGCRVAINGRDEGKLAAAASRMSEESGRAVIGLPGDVSNEAIPRQAHRTGCGSPRWARSPGHQRGRSAIRSIRIV